MCVAQNHRLQATAVWLGYFVWNGTWGTSSWCVCLEPCSNQEIVLNSFSKLPLESHKKIELTPLWSLGSRWFLKVWLGFSFACSLSEVADRFSVRWSVLENIWNRVGNKQSWALKPFMLPNNSKKKLAKGFNIDGTSSQCDHSTSIYFYTGNVHCWSQSFFSWTVS